MGRGSKHYRKGPLFPSMDNPPPAVSSIRALPYQRALPKGQTWLSHQGRRARLRNLRDYCRATLKTKDPILAAAVERLRESVAGEPEPEYGFLHLLYHAIKAAGEADVSVYASINYMIEKWQGRDTAELVNDAERPQTEGSETSPPDPALS